MGYPQLSMYPYPVLKRDVHPPTHPTLDGLMSAPKGTWRIQLFFWGVQLHLQVDITTYNHRVQDVQTCGAP